MKQTRHSLMAKGIMVLLALLVLVFALTYSWFIPPDSAVTAFGLSADVEAQGDFEFAIGFYNNGTGGDYKVTEFTNDSKQFDLEHVVATDNQTYNLLHDYKPIDVTGDGATLIRPAMSYGNSQINTASNDYNIATPNVQYISFDLFFRSQSPDVPVMLGSGSWAKAACEINANETMTGAGATRKSTYGNFSKDAVVGAVRVAFVPYTFAQEAHGETPAVEGLNADNLISSTPQYLSKNASLLWLPRPDIKLNPTAGTTGWTITTGSSATNATYSLSSEQGAPVYHNNKHTYYGIFSSQIGKNVVEYNPTVTPATLAQASQQLSSIGDDIKIGDYYYTKVNVRIWIEGTDIESRRATSGGQFGVNFMFKTS